jgi:hypothetical protein
MLPWFPVVLASPKGLLPRDELIDGLQGFRACGSPRLPVVELETDPGWRDSGHTCSRFQVTPLSQVAGTEAPL